ncbi:hypothetical protein [Jiulongibacter sp. NS-SX5]|uniref:hypothetical protein n=1 Tax=Jiulongibacter sp. NS-SX5 TaxID=3463854 RepID=UPI00405A018B
MKKLILFTAIVIGFTSCEKEDPVIPNEEELITTLIYTLSPVNGGEDVIFKFQDLDGDGGNAPVYTVGTLAANTTYNGSLDLLNELESPAESINEEIEEEDNEHQFFFAVSGLNATLVYTDQDGDGNPVGLSSTLTTGAASNGQLTITLRHEPAKSATGVASGDITNAGGETDIEVTFDVIIQ